MNYYFSFFRSYPTEETGLSYNIALFMSVFLAIALDKYPCDSPPTRRFLVLDVANFGGSTLIILSN